MDNWETTHICYIPEKGISSFLQQNFQGARIGDRVIKAAIDGCGPYEYVESHRSDTKLFYQRFIHAITAYAAGQISEVTKIVYTTAFEAAIKKGDSKEIANQKGANALTTIRNLAVLQNQTQDVIPTLNSKLLSLNPEI